MDAYGSRLKVWRSLDESRIKVTEIKHDNTELKYTVSKNKIWNY